MVSSEVIPEWHQEELLFFSASMFLHFSALEVSSWFADGAQIVYDKLTLN